MPFEVIPTYSGGSPAQVDEATARRVAWQEKQAYERNLEGIYGEEAQAKAEARGLGNIVLEWTLRRGTTYEYEDLITGERVIRKSLVPRTGYNIFVLSPRDAKRGMTVTLRDGTRATLVSRADVLDDKNWLMKPNDGGPIKTVALTSAMPEDYLRQKVNQ